MERREYIPTTAVIGELREWFAGEGEADVVTFSGSGEPTLHSRFGEVIDAIHELGSLPVVLLTNGTLLSDPAVRRDAARADVVKFSLSVWNDDSLRALNQPVAGLTYKRLVEGIKCFRREFAGELRAEVMVVRGINDHERALELIADQLREIKPDRIELNTVVRPPADPDAAAVEMNELSRYARLFEPMAEIPVCRQTVVAAGTDEQDASLLSVLRRRPCPLAELVAVTGLAEADVKLRLANLVAQGQLRKVRQQGKIFYVAGEVA